MEFIIDSVLHKATKKDFEEALGINNRDENFIALHSLPNWEKDDADARSLYVVPITNSKMVRHLKPEVDLIQKISRWTFLPRIGNRDKCSDMLLKLSHAIYHEKHFDVAHFLLREMCIAIETPDHGLPYGHYIFCFLRHKGIIPKEFIGESSLLGFLPKVMEQQIILKSLAARIVEFSKEVDKSKEKYVKSSETLESGLEEFEKVMEEEVRRQRVVEKRLEKPFFCQAYKRRSQTDS
jgi:hypothetical protein